MFRTAPLGLPSVVMRFVMIRAASSFPFPVPAGLFVTLYFHE